MLHVQQRLKIVLLQPPVSSPGASFLGETILKTNNSHKHMHIMKATTVSRIFFTQDILKQYSHRCSS